MARAEAVLGAPLPEQVRALYRDGEGMPEPLSETGARGRRIRPPGGEWRPFP